MASSSEDALESAPDDGGIDDEVEMAITSWDPNVKLCTHSGLVPPYSEGGLVRLDARPWTIHGIKLEEATTACGCPLRARRSMLAEWPETP